MIKKTKKKFHVIEVGNRNKSFSLQSGSDSTDVTYSHWTVRARLTLQVIHFGMLITSENPAWILVQLLFEEVHATYADVEHV